MSRDTFRFHTSILLGCKFAQDSGMVGLCVQKPERERRWKCESQSGVILTNRLEVLE
jgi:hypothetical protein